MCLIIYKPKDKSISKDRLEKAYRTNPDGWGLMFISNRFGCARDITGFKHFNSIYHPLKKYSDILIHFRTASSGQISIDNCHPIFVNENLAFMENGNIWQYSNYFPGRKGTRHVRDCKRCERDCSQRYCFPCRSADSRELHRSSMFSTLNVRFIGRYNYINCIG